MSRSYPFTPSSVDEAPIKRVYGKCDIHPFDPSVVSVDPTFMQCPHEGVLTRESWLSTVSSRLRDVGVDPRGIEIELPEHMHYTRNTAIDAANDIVSRLNFHQVHEKVMDATTANVAPILPHPVAREQSIQEVRSRKNDESVKSTREAAFELRDYLAAERRERLIKSSGMWHVRD